MDLNKCDSLEFAKGIKNVILNSFPDKPGAFHFPGPVIEIFETFTECPDVVVEYRHLDIRVMIFNKEHLFESVRAAYTGTIGISETGIA